MTSAALPTSGQNHPRGRKAPGEWGPGNTGIGGLDQQMPESSAPGSQLLHPHKRSAGPSGSLLHPPSLSSATHVDHAKSQKPYLQLLRGQGRSGWPQAVYVPITLQYNLLPQVDPDHLP